MNAGRVFSVFLLVLSVGLGLTNITGNQSSYNPDDLISLTIYNDAIPNGYNVYVNLGNSSTTFNCTTTDFTYDTNGYASPFFRIPIDLINGAWTINISTQGLAETNSSAFTLNSTAMLFNISAPKSFSPSSTFTYSVMTNYSNGAAFNINISKFVIVANVSNILTCSAPGNITAGYAGNYTGTCTVNATANASDYLLRAIYPSSTATDTLTVNITYGVPNIVLNVTSISLEKGGSTHVNASVRSNSNIGETLDIGISCDGSNVACSPNTTLSLISFGRDGVTMTISAGASATAGTYTVYVNASNQINGAVYNRTSLSVVVNPAHTFTLAGNLPSQNSTVLPGQTAHYSFNITNTGDAATAYNFSCDSSSANFTCSFNVSNGASIGSGSTTVVGVDVALASSTPALEFAKTDINITDVYGLSKLLSGLYFNTTAAGSIGTIIVTNTSQYVHSAGENYYFNISINNTGNLDANDTIFNITITAQNTNDWAMNVSNNFGVTYSPVSDINTINFTLAIGNLSSKNIMVLVTVPTGTSYQNFTKLFIYASSALNGTRNSGNASVLIKIPQYIVNMNMTFNNTIGAEKLSWIIYNITKEPGIRLNLTYLNYTIWYQSTTVMASNNTATNNTLYSSNSTMNSTTWPGNDVYSINVTWNSTENYNFTWSGTFYLGRWISVSATASPSTVANQGYFNVTATVVFGTTAISVNNSVSGNPFNSMSFIGSTGGTCPGTPDVNTTYYFSNCRASTTTNTSYLLNVSAYLSTCSRDFNCTFVNALYNYSLVNVTETYSGTTTTTGDQGAPAGNTTQQQIAQQLNQTLSTATGLQFTMPTAISLENARTIVIALNNTNSSLQNITVVVNESGDYIHFNMQLKAPTNISGGAVSTINVTFTPMMWAKPGTYTVTLNLNSAIGTFTVTIPQPSDTKKVHRYVEVSKDKTRSLVTLAAKNRNTYSITMNITENISKQLASTASAVNITSNFNYTIIQDDPIIMWTLNLTSNQEKAITYLLAGNLGDSSLFKEPTTTETRISGGGFVLDLNTTLLIIGVIVAALAGAVVYLFVIKPRREKLPPTYAPAAPAKISILDSVKSLPSVIVPALKDMLTRTKTAISRIVPKKAAVEQKPEEPKPEDKSKKLSEILQKPNKPKPSKDDLLKKLNEVYKK